MLIYIVRHGETNLNNHAVMQGWLDEPLNENGRKLAAITGKEMKGILFDKCISSPLVRAKETVGIILRESGNNIPIFTDDRIKEINFGDLEGKRLSEMGETGELFFTDPFNFAGFPNGERIRDVCKRSQAFLKELIQQDDGKTYLIGAHGCALRAMLNWLYDDPNDFWHVHVPYNCAVSIVEIKEGKASLIVDDKVYYDQDLIVDLYRRK